MCSLTELAASKQYACLGPEGIALFRRLALGVVGEEIAAEATRADLLAAFSDLSTIVWQSLSPLIGKRGVEAVLLRAARLAGERHPLLQLLVITPEGVTFTRLQDDESVELALLHAALTDLFATTTDLLCSLIGIDLLRPMLARMERLS
jgi:hypothetical protein